jgi:hypothetical protein
MSRGQVPKLKPLPGDRFANPILRIDVTEADRNLVELDDQLSIGKRSRIIA